MSQKKQVVSVRPTSNDDIREYHLVLPEGTISDSPYEGFWHPMHGSEAEFEALGPKGKKLAQLLMAQRYEKSITRISFRPQSIKVYKAPTADWASVEKDIIIPTFKEVFGNIEAVQYGTAKYRELVLA